MKKRGIGRQIIPRRFSVVMLIQLAFISALASESVRAQSTGDCCLDNGTPGCVDPACEAAVCAVDPFCCNSTWDQICADQAAVLCRVCSCFAVCTGTESLEGEPICFDGVVDDFNGGCNSVPSVFQTITCATAICGSSGTYTTGGPMRDTDWYEVNITTETIFTWNVIADFDVQIFILDGTNGCPGVELAGTSAGPCTNAILTSTCLGPGTYWFFVSPLNFTGVPCGAEYTAVLTCESCACNLACVPPAVPEGEPVCFDDYVDVTNGGCNSTPEVFQPIQCGDVICGTSGTYLDGATTVRDTDWYQITVTTDSILTWSVTADFVPQLFILNGTAGCAGSVELVTTTGIVCQQTTVESGCVGPGTYWLFVAPNSFFGVPCGGQYIATLTCTPCDCGVVCDPLSTNEGETECFDGYVDTFNAGCNATPTVFNPILCGEQICGTSGTYVSGGPQRDTDWYRYVSDHSVSFTWQVTAEFPMQIVVLDGAAGCVTPVQIGEMFAEQCIATTITTGCLPPGEYWFFVAPQSFTGVPCGSNYTATLTCTPCEPNPCAGDVNGDMVVNVIDLLLVLGQWGVCPTNCVVGQINEAQCSTDATLDCLVSINDLLEVLGQWGACSG